VKSGNGGLTEGGFIESTLPQSDPLLEDGEESLFPIILN